MAKGYVRIRVVLSQDKIIKILGKIFEVYYKNLMSSMFNLKINSNN